MNNSAPFPRRQFLGAAAAVSGGFLLAASATGMADAGPLGRIAMTDSPNASPDGTTIPSAGSITDNGGHVWTVSNGVIYRDGGTVGTTYNVSLLLWYGGMIYHAGTGGQFYVCNASVWRPCADPRTPLTAPNGMFYGINGHPDTAFSPSVLAGVLQGLGCSTYRINVYPGVIQTVATIAQELQSAGITVFPVIDLSPDQGGVLFANEGAAYDYGHSGAAQIAGALQPYGVTMYECGNELTQRSYMLDHANDAGTKAADWNNATWPLMRGVMRGMIDGVKSVQPDALCGINFCKSDIGAADALWDGMQPDNSGGYPPVRWDITTWHTYESEGDIFHIGTDGAGPSFNLPVYCKARFGRPFMMTEWNGDNPGSHRAAYITQRLGEYLGGRSTDGFQSAMFYTLQDTDYGIVDLNANPVDPPYTAFTNFVTAHPDS
ncbi:MAG: hypothetical protein JWN09_729 [Microbacteriaceae bacterium]|nr:hypothetical protein [Microbacteriaceae bacterium]